MRTLLAVIILPLWATLSWQSALAQSAPTRDEMHALAPTGKLRAALYLGGPTNVVKAPETGYMIGVGYELGKELARHLGVPYEPVIYQTTKLLIESVNSGKWDISFIAQDPDRERILDFTGVYLSLEHSASALVAGGNHLSRTRSALRMIPLRGNRDQARVRKVVSAHHRVVGQSIRDLPADARWG